jgi:hypothetical protein
MMAEGIENFILEHLRHIRAAVDALREDVKVLIWPPSTERPPVGGLTASRPASA